MPEPNITELESVIKEMKAYKVFSWLEKNNFYKMFESSNGDSTTTKIWRFYGEGYKVYYNGGWGSHTFEIGGQGMFSGISYEWHDSSREEGIKITDYRT